MTDTRHNHDRQPFGKRKPLGECPRCDELHNGARPRPGWVAVPATSGPTDGQVRDHFNSAKHRNECGHVCTYGDW